MTTHGTILMNAEEIDRTLARMAHQILETSPEPANLALVGIQNRGVPLAQRLARKILEDRGCAPPVGLLDINLYRDDLSRVADYPVVRRTEIPFTIRDRAIVLVDDVLYTGRTIRAAMDALVDLGRPRVIRLAVLIDRGGRELPIQADFIGRTFMVGPEQLVEARLQETDGGPDRVFLQPVEIRPPAPAKIQPPPARPARAPAKAKGKTKKKIQKHPPAGAKRAKPRSRTSR